MAEQDRDVWIRENLAIQALVPGVSGLDADGLGREWDGLYAHYPPSFRSSLARTASASRRSLERQRSGA